MRASRLLRLLLILQNRGRMTSVQLAGELEVAPRTILRDVDALTEAGLPIIVHQGNQGGIELGFNYRTRLTGLAADEAEAIAVILSRPAPELAWLGLAEAGERARAKLFESFPDGVRHRIDSARRRFKPQPPVAEAIDPRVVAMAGAIRRAALVRLRAHSPAVRTIHPVGLVFVVDGVEVIDDLDPDHPISIQTWGDINISAQSFARGESH